MRLRLGQKVFAPSLFATVLVIVLLPIFISLACWQLRRADEKRVLMSQAAAGQSQFVMLNALNADQLPRYQHVQVQGVFDAQHQVLLDSMASSRGQPGYRVWTPLKLSDESIVLVDRGWIAKDIVSHDKQPVRGVLQVDTQQKKISGIIDELPRPGIRAGTAGVSNTWPQVLNYPRLEELKNLYGPSLQSRIVLMDADSVDGFERQWQIKQGFSPERHIGYAVQWFGFAITLLIIYFVINLKHE